VGSGFLFFTEFFRLIL